jgi:hypothetical protein
MNSKSSLKPSQLKLIMLFAVPSMLWACGGQEQAVQSTTSPAAEEVIQETENAAPNVLVLIADDLGVEQLASFGIGSQPASTPNLDRLAQQGMSFSNVWSQPICSPTRATLLTGRYGFRTGVGTATPERIGGEYPELGRAEDGSPDLSSFTGLADKPLEVYEDLGPVFREFRRYFATDDDPTDGPFYI